MFFSGRPPQWQALRQTGQWVTLALVVAAAALFTNPVHARGPVDGAAPVPLAQAPLAQLSLAQLPAEARATHRLIQDGGPFPYRKDGSVFGNRERVLPAKRRGHYREYTVQTPGSRDRGARRIVCGGTPPTNPEACYYTDDHYSTFRQIAQ